MNYYGTTKLSRQRGIITAGLCIASVGCWELPAFDSSDTQNALDNTTSASTVDTDDPQGSDSQSTQHGDTAGGSDTSETGSGGHLIDTEDRLDSEGGFQEFFCVDGKCMVSGTLLRDQTWTPDRVYLLKGTVFVGDDHHPTVLTVEPGTVIQGDFATTGTLVVNRGSKIMAEGAPDAPIIFTSAKPQGQRRRGDWGGVIVNGKARINTCDEGVCEALGEGGTGRYGGDNDEDDSGILSYVRIEFAGKQLGPDNELNGLALQGVGSKTRIDHLHLHMNKDDGIEFFGGTASFKYVLATGTGDDNLDWTEGWRGKGQFFVAQQYWDDADNGIEADNNSSDNLAEPIAAPELSHMTLIGSPESDSSDIGILLREGTRGSLSNVIAVGFEGACLDVDDEATWRAVSGGDLRITRSIISCLTPFGNNYAETDPEGVSVEFFFGADTTNLQADPRIDEPFDLENPHFAPLPDSPALTGGRAPSDPFFTPASYIGGVDPEGDWIAQGLISGWISFKAS